MKSAGIHAVFACALTIASTAHADVRFEETVGYLPSGYESPWSFFESEMSPFAQAGSFLETGVVRSCLTGVDDQVMISIVGPMSGSTLVRSHPVLTGVHWPGAAAYVRDAAEPTVIVAGYGIEVYAGSPLVLRSRISGAASGDVKTLAIARYVDENNFDLVGVDYDLAFVHVANGTASFGWAGQLPAANSVAVVPASGPVPAHVVGVNNGFTVVYDLDGNVVWSTNSGGWDVVSGTLGAASTPVFVVRGYSGEVRAYAANPPSMLWQRPGLEAATVLIGDMTLDGVNELMVGTARGVLQRLNPDGTNYGNPITLPGASGDPGFSMRLIQSRVAGLSVPQMIVVADTQYFSDEVHATFVYTPNLLTQLDVETAQTGTCNSVRVADVDGDGRDEIVTLGSLADYGGTGLESTVRIADADDGSEQWIGTLPGPVGTTSIDQYVDFDVGNAGYGSDHDIVLAGNDAVPVVTVLDGATHAIRARATPALAGATLVSAVRIVPGTTSPHSILIDANDYNVRSLHLLNAATLQETWTSGPITGAQPGFNSSLEIATFAAGPDPHAIFTAWLSGVYSYDLVTHTQDYFVPGGPMVGTLLPPLSGITRFAYFDISDPGHQVIRIIDAASGALLDEFSPGFQVLQMAGDPIDPQRLLVQDDRRIYAIRLDAHRIEAQSAHVALPPPMGRALVVRERDGAAVIYAGTSMGVSAFRLVPTETSIFRSGFEVL